MKDEWWDALPERMGAAFEMVAKIILNGSLMLFGLGLIVAAIAVLYEIVSDPETRQEALEATEDIGEALDTTVGDFVRDSVGYCQELWEELEYDWQCMDSDDCVMTRDELVAYEERLGYLDEYCKGKVRLDKN